jgi:hypothetical protein
MINSDEIITYICLILSFINISLWFYVYFIDNNIIQYIIYIFTIFILLFITLIIYISVKKNSYNNIIIFDEFYYIRIGLIILNLICYSFYIKYFLKDKSTIKKGGGFINKIIITRDNQGVNYDTYLENYYLDLFYASENITTIFIDIFNSDSPNSDSNKFEKEMVAFLLINNIIKKLNNDETIKFDKDEFYRILYNYINDEILFNSNSRL